MKRNSTNFDQKQKKPRDEFDDSESHTSTSNLETFTNTFNHLANVNRSSSSFLDPFARASKLMFEYYNKSVQSHETFNRKVELKEAIYHMFKDLFPYLGVYIVGSSANGFGTNESDVDICLMISREDLNQKTEAVFLLKLIAKALRKTAFIRNLNVISAKVPIIKFFDTQNQIECDLNINNSIGIRNTHLLRCYSELDWRVRPLILNIKRWAKFHNINDASQQTISSYSLTLMTIYYLQAVCKPAVLPVLQELYPDKFNFDLEVSDLRLNEELPVYTSTNIETLGQLFSGFLDFYSKFNFEYCVISVRTGSIIPKNCLPPERYEYDSQKYSQWKYILIEEPYELTNTARSVFDYYVYKKIIEVFKKSAIRLAQNKNLDSLFSERFYEN